MPAEDLKVAFPMANRLRPDAMQMAFPHCRFSFDRPVCQRSCCYAVKSEGPHVFDINYRTRSIYLVDSIRFCLFLFLSVYMPIYSFVYLSSFLSICSQPASH